MKYSIRHLLALTVLLALAVQVYPIQKSRQEIRRLEIEQGQALKQLQKIETQARYRRQHHQFCEEVTEGYEYPGDFFAARDRYQRLQRQELPREP